MGKPVPLKAKREFAAMLKQWRADKKLTQPEAARVLEIPLKTLQNWEIARTKPTGIGYAALLKVISRK